MTPATQPPDWREVPVADLITISHGFAFKGEFFSPQGSDALATPGNFIESGGFRYTGDKQQYYTTSFPESYRLDAGDLIVAMTEQSEGLLGSAAFIPRMGHWLHNQRVGRIRPKSGDVSLNFLFHVFNSRNFRKAVAETAAGTKVRHTSPTKLGAIKILLPPKRERERIAETLDSMDKMILRLERLNKKKQAIKQGIMQQLLTGTTRLPGFEDRWEFKTLREIVQTPITDGPHMTPKFLKDGIPFLSVNNLVNNRIDFSELRYISAADHALFSKKCAPRKGDILLGKAASVGKVAIVDTDLEFNIWSPIAMIRIGPGQVPRFVFYQLQSSSAIAQIALLTNSSTQGNIGMGDIEKLKVYLPPKAEQAAISQVLLDADKEIDATVACLSKAKFVKQGMVQELLTGRTRLLTKETVS